MPRKTIVCCLCEFLQRGGLPVSVDAALYPRLAATLEEMGHEGAARLHVGEGIAGTAKR